MGSAFPFAATASSGANVMTPSVERRVVSSTMTEPTGSRRLETRGGVDDVARDDALSALRASA